MLARQNALFEEWKTGRDNFVTDGVVDETAYRNAKKKVLFLLKEVNGGENWDLCQYVRDGGRSYTWDNVARWVEGIERLDEEIPWSELSKNSKSNQQRREEQLKKICVVNVKKKPGKETSVWEEIEAAGEADAEFLKKQIAIYEPEIIVCCGTDAIYSKYLAENKIKWKMTRRGIWYAQDGRRIVIAYLHPNARLANNFMYYSLIDAVKELLS